MRPPRPEARPHVHQEHGVDRPDPYHWLRDRDDPAVTAHIQAENAWTDARTAHLEELRKALFTELLGRIQEDDSSVPALDGGWLYYVRTVAGAPYTLHCRRRAPDGPEELLLDENTLAQDGGFLDVGDVEVSPDHALLLWTVDRAGDEVYDLHVRRLADGAALDTLAEVGSACWSGGSDWIWYTKLDDTLRPYQVWRHRLGADAAEDVLVYEEEDPEHRVGIGRTRDERWLLVVSGSSRTTEVRYAPAQDATAPLTLFCARHEHHEYSVDSQGGRFFILTNDSDDEHGAHDERARTFALKTCQPDATDRAAWTTLVPAREDVTLEGLDVFDDFIVLYEREGGLVHLRIIDRDGADHRVAMPEAAWSVGPSENPRSDQQHYRFTYTSLVTPPTVFDWDRASGRLIHRKTATVLGGFDRERYVTRRLFARSADGVAIPISLVHRRDVLPDGERPTLLYGYGSYGVPLDPSFRSSRLSLLDRGVVYAIAHVRGGADLGRAWYDVAREGGKQHTFDDFIACARALIDAGWTRPERLAIEGGSAGGTLVGAALNQAPRLFCAAIAEVPFVDCVSTMLDPTLPLTTSDYPEWGNPEDEGAFRSILAWSPYDNVHAGPYPALLVTCGLNDPRVAYWEPLKWVARLRERAEAEVDVRIWTGAGHAGNSGRYGYLEDLAFVWSWLLEKLGLAGGAA
jgi:oligopeptidase B